MTSNTFKRSILVSTGTYLPPKVVKNDVFHGKTMYHYAIDGERLKEVTCTEDAIMERMGVRERHYATPQETPVMMGAEALFDMFNNNALSPEDLEGIITATVTGQHCPSTSCEVVNYLAHHAVSLDTARGFYQEDVGDACTGFLKGLTTADSLILAEGYKSFGVIGVERLSDHIFQGNVHRLHEKDYTGNVITPLFGDGAGAIMLYHPRFVGKFTGRLVGEIVATHHACDPTEKLNELIYIDDQESLHMPNGPLVKRHAVRKMVDAVQKVLEKTMWAVDDVDLVIPHQANKRITDDVPKQLGMPPEKVYVNIDKHGNMSSATIPVALHEALQENRIHDGSNVVLVAFGAGLSWSAVGLHYKFIT